MSQIEIKPIPHSETVLLRRAVFLPSNPAFLLVRSGDLRDTAIHLGGFVEDRLVGVFSAEDSPRSADDPPNTYRAHSLAVLDEARESGVGKQLFIRMLQELRERGCQRAWGTPRPSALSFYKQLGVEPTGERWAYEGDPTLLHVVVMDREFMDAVFARLSPATDLPNTAGGSSSMLSRSASPLNHSR